MGDGKIGSKECFNVSVCHLVGLKKYNLVIYVTIITSSFLVNRFTS